MFAQKQKISNLQSVKVIFPEKVCIASYVSCIPTTPPRRFVVGLKGLLDFEISAKYQVNISNIWKAG